MRAHALAARFPAPVLVALVALVALLATPAVADEKPTVSVALLEASTHPDARWFGENAYLFKAAGVTASGLEGHTLTWTLEVKRKLAAWKTAKSWLVTKQKVTSAQLPIVTFGLIYRSLAKAKLQPGEHVAAFVATDDTGRVVYRGELGFNLPASGKNAYIPRDYR